MTDLTLADIDRDGAIGEALDGVYGSTRADLIRKAALGGGALLAALAVPPPAGAGTNDVPILNFDLAFEYLQSTFYTEAESIGTVAAMGRRKAQWARVLGAHERAHVEILKSVLGKKAAKKPFFDFRGITESEDGFTRTAVAMEDLTVALLLGQIPRLNNLALVAAVFSLLTTEARHAAWARSIVGASPVRTAFDEPRRIPEVRTILASTRFIASRPTTRVRRGPRFTG